jgi:Uma2 family endonuclease
MVQYKPLQSFPTEEDLPETDHRSVDNELQIMIPALLREILAYLWADRVDWYLGINLGVYYAEDEPAIVPDAFLSLGVQRFRQNGKLRLNYAIPHENQVVPQWVLEVVSKTPGGEYDDKMKQYAQLGVLYYTIYNPDYWVRDQHTPFEVYRLQDGGYVRQPENPVWMPEIGLGIGCELGRSEEIPREWLYWYDQQGRRYLVPEELLRQAKRELATERQQRRLAELELEQERQLREQERQRANEAERRAEELVRRLRELGQEP